MNYNDPILKNSAGERSMKIKLLMLGVLGALLVSCTKAEAKALAENKHAGSGSGTAHTDSAVSHAEQSVNGSELVTLHIPQEGIRFPIGLRDDGIGGENTKLYDETGTIVITEGFLRQSYAIGKYEVSYRLWKQVYDWAHTGAGKEKGYSFREGEMGYAKKEKEKSALHEDHPVTKVSWYDCIVWCNAYSEMIGVVPAYYKKGIADEGGNIKAENRQNYNRWVLRDAKAEKKDCDSLVQLSAKELGKEKMGNGFRLPTWLEWQLAAKLTDKESCIVVEKDGVPRTGTVNGKQWYFTKGSAVSGGSYDLIADRQRFSVMAEDASRYANYGVTFQPKNEAPLPPPLCRTVAIGSLMPNALGIHNMSGNVSEWCMDYVPKIKAMPAGRCLQGGNCAWALEWQQHGEKGGFLPANTRGGGFEAVCGLRICRTE